MTVQELIKQSERQLASKLNQESFKKDFFPVPIIVDHLSEAIKQGYELGLQEKEQLISNINVKN